MCALCESNAKLHAAADADEKRLALVKCHRCPQWDRPIYLDGDHLHICGDCWMEDRANEPQFDPMPWELGT